MKPMWFIYDAYTVAGRPKAEKAVMDYARRKYLHNLVCEPALEDIQMDLESYCAKIREENKRLASVNIRVTDTKNREDGRAIIRIGEQFLRCLKVRNIIDY